MHSEGSNQARTIAEARACVEEWQAMSCADLYAPKLHSCVSPGARQLGEACIASSQCETRRCSGGFGSCGECMAVSDRTSCSADEACPGLSGMSHAFIAARRMVRAPSVARMDSVMGLDSRARLAPWISMSARTARRGWLATTTSCPATSIPQGPQYSCPSARFLGKQVTAGIQRARG